MRHAAICAFVIIVAGACALSAPGCLAKGSRTPLTATVKGLEMSPQEFRVRVRALIRPTLGTVEEAADKIIGETSDTAVRRGAIVWKIETTNTMLAAMLRTDPALALADSWGYAIQLQNRLERTDVGARFGASAPVALKAISDIQQSFRDLARTVQPGIDGASFEARIKQWADRNPIQGALYRRPSMDTAVAATMAGATEGGAFAALGNLEETTADVMARLDLYTVYLPRLARWEAELAVDDVTQGTDVAALAANFDRVSKAADRIAALAETAPDVVARERVATLEAVEKERIAALRDLHGESAAVIAALQQERIATLAEIEAITQRIIDRTSGPLNAAVREDLHDLVMGVEEMRLRLMDDVQASLNRVVDHAFWKAVELMLIGAGVGAVGVVLYAKLIRR